MSADDYMLIRKDEDKFCVTHHMGDDAAPPLDMCRNIVTFDSLQEAWDYAKRQDTEYGVETDFPISIAVTEQFPWPPPR